MLMIKMKANSLSLVAEEEAVLACDLVPGKDEFKKTSLNRLKVTEVSLFFWKEVLPKL